jgi:glycosyltransferase involved in cell wall biosynthesis
MTALAPSLRVALVGDYPLTESEIGGGVESAFLYLVSGLRRRGDLDLHVVTLDRRTTEPREERVDAALTVHVLPVFPRFELLRRFGTYRRWLAATLGRIGPDVVHVQGATDHAYAALACGYPTVITVHGILREDAAHQPTLPLRLRKAFYARAFERQNVAHARHLIAIAGYVTDYFRDVLRRDVAVYLIPNAIDPRFFDIGPLPGARTVLFAGRVIERKRVDLLVDAFAAVAEAVPDATLRIAGEMSSEARYAAGVRDRVERLGLADRVRFLGQLDEPTLAAEFEAADVLALPSAQETAPMVIAEAMAAARPVVATAVGGVAEMVVDRETGFLVDRDDVSGFGRGLTAVLEDVDLARRLGQRARVIAEREYRADRVADRTAEVYRRMTAEGSGR